MNEVEKSASRNVKAAIATSTQALAMVRGAHSLLSAVNERTWDDEEIDTPRAERELRRAITDLEQALDAMGVKDI